MIRAADWKYCLVKWQGLEHDQVTWELTSEIYRIFRDASTSSLFGEFEMRVRSQFCAQHDTKYRLSLMRSRRHALRDPEGQAVPVTLAVEKANSNLRLLDHQKKGVHWLLEAWRQSRNVMLADEMGLGKTIQTIAFIKELMAVHKITRPFLISVPLSTIENWRREFKLWCPEAHVVTYRGRA